MSESEVIEFEKWHGLGNDFVLVRREALPGDWPVDRFVQWCDRRRGIGADGVLVLSGESAEGLTVEVVNRDGSVPEICGNGTRCAVRSWAARRGVVSGDVAVETRAGRKHCRFDARGLVSIDMGPARLVDDCLPAHEANESPLELPIRVADRDYLGLAVSMGNPHLVIFARSWGDVSGDEARRLEHFAGFPNRTNVSFAVEPRDGRIPLRVWERGVGFTQACGSAACATAVAAVATGRVEADSALTVSLPGGDLSIRVSADLRVVEKTGPAVFVFSGVVGSASPAIF